MPKWRAIRDDKGRIVVAICHNMHLGDAWEWADDARISRKLLLHGVSHRHQLHRLRHDALTSMFEWLFKYPPTVFLHGQLVLRSAWPRWPLVLGIIAVGRGARLALRGRRASDTRLAGAGGCR